jgi:K(+)-stimulated pyrophosphate-energized sodium pump
MALLAAYIEEVKSGSASWPSKAPTASSALPDRLHYRRRGTDQRQRPRSDFVNAYDLTIMNPLLCGMFIGAMMAFVFCAMTMKAVGRAAGAMVEEVRRQFKEKSRASWKGTDKPDYARCVAISTKGAQREMMCPRCWRSSCRSAPAWSSACRASWACWRAA